MMTWRRKREKRRFSLRLDVKVRPPGLKPGNHGRLARAASAALKGRSPTVALAAFVIAVAAGNSLEKPQRERRLAPCSNDG